MILIGERHRTYFFLNARRHFQVSQVVFDLSLVSCRKWWLFLSPVAQRRGRCGASGDWALFFLMPQGGGLEPLLAVCVWPQVSQALVAFSSPLV